MSRVPMRVYFPRHPRQWNRSWLMPHKWGINGGMMAFCDSPPHFHGRRDHFSSLWLSVKTSATPWMDCALYCLRNNRCNQEQSAVVLRGVNTNPNCATLSPLMLLVGCQVRSDQESSFAKWQESAMDNCWGSTGAMDTYVWWPQPRVYLESEILL